MSDSWRRSIRSAEYLFRSGNGPGAQALLEKFADSVPPGPHRADVLWHLARIRHERSDFGTGCIDLLRQALDQVGIDDGLRARSLNELAWVEYYYDLRESSRHAREAVAAAEASGDPGLLANSLASLGYFASVRGVPEEAAEAFERGMAVEAHDEELYVAEGPGWVRAVARMFQDGFDEARETYRSRIDQAIQQGEENSLSWVRFHLGLLETWAGNWAAAQEQIDRAEEESAAIGIEARGVRNVRAMVHALRGRLAEARTEAASVLEDQVAMGQPGLAQARARSTLGFIALSEGDADGAVRQLAEVEEVLRGVGAREPGFFRTAPDLAEAYVISGDLTAAEYVTDGLEECGRRLDRAYALATGARCRSLVLAARGEVDAALAAAAEALRHHERLPQPFELARTLLVKGRIERRAKHRRDARESLERAVSLFEELGAPTWADQARAELARIGGRAPGAADLTSTEERVAALAAEGLTNREIADRLFMGLKTVEGNLSRVYRKLGVRSRTELARRLGAA